MVGYEIKSDVDSKDRLHLQIRSYAHVFDKMYLVTTKARREYFASLIPDWWGIMLVSPDGDMKILRRARHNVEVSICNVLYLLNLTELKSVAKALRVRTVGVTLRGDIISLIAVSKRSRVIRAEVRRCLKERAPLIRPRLP